MIWLIGLFTKSVLGRYLAGAFALLVVALAGVSIIFRRGQMSERQKTARKTIKAHEVRNEVERKVTSAGNARERLRRDWTRP